MRCAFPPYGSTSPSVLIILTRFMPVPPLTSSACRIRHGFRPIRSSQYPIVTSRVRCLSTASEGHYPQGWQQPGSPEPLPKLGFQMGVGHGQVGNGLRAVPQHLYPIPERHGGRSLLKIKMERHIGFAPRIGSPYAAEHRDSQLRPTDRPDTQ